MESTPFALPASIAVSLPQFIAEHNTRSRRKYGKVLGPGVITHFSCDIQNFGGSNFYIGLYASPSELPDVTSSSSTDPIEGIALITPGVLRRGVISLKVNPMTYGADFPVNAYVPPGALNLYLCWVNEGGGDNYLASFLCYQPVPEG